MRHQYTNPANLLASTASSETNTPLAPFARAIAAIVLLLAFLIVPSANAQQPSFIRPTFSQNRITVPLGVTNTTTITNFINLGNGCTNADFNVTGLPAGTSYILTDTNGAPLSSLTSDSNLWLTVFSTNIAEGIYPFQLNGGGLDTNGQPVTNSIPLFFQAAHVWNGSLNTSNAWSTAASWLTGVPGASSDVVFGDTGAQTNGFIGGTLSNIPFTNSVVDASFTISSLRFSQTGSTNFNSVATNPPPIFHHLQILSNATLTVTGTNGFSLMSDDFNPRDSDIRQMNVTIDGAGGKMVVSNLSASVAILNPSINNAVASLNMSNLDTFISRVSRFGLADYQLYPNYRNFNAALNVGRDTNQYTGLPAQMTTHLALAKTNILFSGFIDPQNYANEYTRTYGFELFNNEQQGIGSSTAQNFFLGISNIFLADGVCFYGSAGNGTTRFWSTNGSAVFRNTNGTSRVSIFTVSDGGGTNESRSNIKGTVDFSAGSVDILADKFYMARDRTLLSTNDSENFQATVTIGKGTVDVNTAILGDQEHTKPDWTTNGGGAAYLGYARGSLTVTSNGIFKVNGNLTLGFTADTNNVNNAQQYNTFGQITIASNSTVAASNIICDGGLNYHDTGNARQNNITINTGGILIVSNTIGSTNFIGTDLNTFFNPGPQGLPLDNLFMAPGSIFTVFVTAGKTNAYVRNLASSGIAPGFIRIASLPTFPSYPTNLSIIQYSSATPILAADMSIIGGTVQGYIINNSDNQTIDLFLTTNAPRQLVWKGTANNNWDLHSLNWVPVGGGSATNFSMGDIAIFDDSSTVTNVSITDVVVPNQATNGVTISNSVNTYTFSAGGGSISGTAKIVKQGTAPVLFQAAEAGPFIITQGEVDVGGSFNGIIGSTTVFSNAVLKVLNGGVVNGVTATNDPLTVASGGTINGGLTMVGGSLVNDGTVSALSGPFVVTNNAVVTNDANATIALGNNTGGGASGYEIFAGSTLANNGLITTTGGRLFLNGLYYGASDPGHTAGSYFDNVNTPASASFGRFVLRDIASALLSPGSSVSNSVGDLFMGVRVDLSADNNPGNNSGTFLVDVDITNNVSDTISTARWNNIGCIWVMNKLNGSFQSGQSFRVLVNLNGVNSPNIVDTPTIYPLMQPTVPGPGLQWNLAAIQQFGIVGVTNSALIWDGNGGGNWDTNGGAGNWKNSQVYGDNQGAVFDDSASGLTTVTLNSPVAPAGFNSALTTTNFTTNLTVITTNIVFGFTNTPAFMPGIVVSNALKDYTFVTGSTNPTNRIIGMASLYKTGSGTLTLLTSNDFTGGLVIDRGTLAVTNVGAFGKDPAQKLAYDQIMIDNNALIKFFGPATNHNLSRLISINQNGSTFEVSSNFALLTLGQVITGPGLLTKTGAGILALTQTGNAYQGGTLITAGNLRLTAAAAGVGTVTLNDNTVLELTNTFTLTNSVSLPATSEAISLQGTGTNIVTGPWTGGSATFTSTNVNRQVVFNGDITGVAGTISFGASIGTFRFNNRTNESPCLGSAATTFDLGTNSALLYNVTRTNLTYDLGALAGGANTALSGSSTNGGSASTTYRIGAKGVDSTFAGVISNNADVVTVVKVGGAKLILNGNSVYSGSTTVSNGTLAGTGSIASPLTVAAGGTVSPGNPVGTFTVSNTASIAGTALIALNVSGTPINGKLSATGAITATGALVVTNLGPDIVDGTKFQLFNQLVSGFTSITLPSSNPAHTSSYTWQTNVAVDGSITLLTGGITNSVNTNPTNMTVSASGGNMTITWPGDHLGWQLQSNPISLTATSQWFSILGSTTVTQENMAIDRSKTNVFFRMIYPPGP